MTKGSFCVFVGGVYHGEGVISHPMSGASACFTGFTLAGCARNRTGIFP